MFCKSFSLPIARLTFVSRRLEYNQASACILFDCTHIHRHPVPIATCWQCAERQMNDRITRSLCNFDWHLAMIGLVKIIDEYTSNRFVKLAIVNMCCRNALVLASNDNSQFNRRAIRLNCISYEQTFQLMINCKTHCFDCVPSSVVPLFGSVAVLLFLLFCFLPFRSKPSRFALSMRISFDV